MYHRTRWVSCIVAIAGLLLVHGVASARTTRLDYVWSGNQGTVVFIHGHTNCTDSSGLNYDSRCGTSSVGYWLNSSSDGGDDHDFLDEATARATSGGWVFWEAFSLRYDGSDQAYWSSASDVANCLLDLRNGTNATGCNPNLYRRTSFRVIAHSEGGALIDRIFSTGLWADTLTGSGGAIVGSPVTD